MSPFEERQGSLLTGLLPPEYPRSILVSPLSRGFGCRIPFHISQPRFWMLDFVKFWFKLSLTFLFDSSLKYWKHSTKLLNKINATLSYLKSGPPNRTGAGVRPWSLEFDQARVHNEKTPVQSLKVTYFHQHHSILTWSSALWKSNITNLDSLSFCVLFVRTKQSSTW